MCLVIIIIHKVKSSHLNQNSFEKAAVYKSSAKFDE